MVQVNQDMLDVIIYSDLSNVKRTGWVDRNIPDYLCESVLEHSMHTAIAGFLYNPNLTDMLIIHDLAEAHKKVGDITPYQGISKEKKYELESMGIREICLNLDKRLASKIIKLWEEYAAKKTEKAVLCSQLCKFDAFVKAIHYENLGYENVTDFYPYTKNLLTDKLLINIFDDMMSKRSSLSNPHQYYFERLESRIK